MTASARGGVVLAALMSLWPGPSAAALPSDFFGAFYCKPVGVSHGGLDTVIGERLAQVDGKEVSKPGHLVLAWGAKHKSVLWGSAVGQVDGSIRFVVPGRRGMTFAMSRPKPVEEGDYAPWFTIKEDGGKTYECGYAAG